MQELERTRPALESLTSYNPATGEALGTVPVLGPEEVEAAVVTARAAFPAWCDLGYRGRKRHLLALVDVFVKNAQAIAELLTRENGKPVADAMTEVLASCEFLSYYAKHAATLLADERLGAPNPMMANVETTLHYVPKGVIAVISPWNYPLHLAMAEMAGALAAGNVVILKPSELTPLIGQKVAELAREAQLPAGVIQVVTGDGRTGAALSSAKVDRVCFTGSVATGRKVGVAAMQNLIPSTLELGGKDPALVLDDANVDFTAQGLVWGAFTNAGQVCASVERVYVARSLAEPLIARIVEKTRALTVGNGLDANTEVGPIISETQLQRIAAQVEDARAKGARVLCGGERREGPGHFYMPTVLVDVTPDMEVMRDETFGPLLPILVVDDEAGMITQANDSPYGLSATVWTRDLHRGKSVARRLRAGTVWVNTGLASYANPLTPRGGFKESGLGKIGGRLGLLEMVDAQVIDIAAHGKRADWWFPAKARAADMMLGGLQLLHGRGLGQRLSGLLRYLGSRR